MGLLTKSIALLLVAVSIPLLYKQFADDGTVKFMSSYYSNFKVIDRILRNSAERIELAKDYLPQSKQVKLVIGDLSNTIQDAVRSARNGLKQQEDNKKKQEAVKLVQCPNSEGKGLRLWSKKELINFDGSQQDEVYLAFLGIVYNVTLNLHHYGKGTEYNVFAGRDATRAFVTGDFANDLHDDIKDVVDNKLYSQIESWSSFYKTNYQIIGRVHGSFYDNNGCATPELKRVHQILVNLKQKEVTDQEVDKDLPECNSEWNSDLKAGRVWCSNKSGGIERDWIGFPRVYKDSQADSEGRCVCFNEKGPAANKYGPEALAVYPGCDPRATECKLA